MGTELWQVSPQITRAVQALYANHPFRMLFMDERGIPVDTELQIDIPLLRKALEWATAEHRRAQLCGWSEWDQSKWCGTSHCIAGHIALELGWTRVGYGLDTSFVERDGEGERLVPEVAREALGLDAWSANMLFMSNNTIEKLWDLANYITNGAIEIPADLPT